MSLTSHIDSSKDLVIIGGGIAGITCAQTYNYLRPNDKISIISQSPLVKSIFNVNKISKSLEEFEVKESDPNDIFGDNSSTKNIKVTIASVLKIDTDKHLVYLDNNSTLKYDYLSICSGARPKLIKIENIELQKYIIGIRDTETVKDLKERLVDAKKVLIVGNGGIALELVHEISMCQVIWSIKDSHIGNAFFDNDAANFLFDSRDLNQRSKQEELENETNNNNENNNEDLDLMIVDRSLSEELPTSNKSSIGPQWYSKYKFIGGVDGSKIKEHNIEPIIEYGTTVKQLLNGDEEWPVYVELSNGKRYGCNFVISATGVITNDDLIQVEPQPLKTGLNGYIVDENMMTSINDVFAAGDVADISQWPNLSELWFPMKLWSQARTMGRYTAQSIAKHTKQSYTDEISTRFEFEIFAHVTRFFNMKVVMLGLYNGQRLKINDEEDGIVTYHKVKLGKLYIKIILRHGRLVGALLIGETDLEETFENLMMNQIDLSRFGQDILNSDIDIEDYFD